jgi:hypothetical protein
MLNDSDSECAKRYRWFCTIGYRTTVLNHPKIILDKANPDDVDQIIHNGMMKIPNLPWDDEQQPQCAA